MSTVKKKILIVDDEPNIALSLKVTFHDSGYEVHHVENGEKCLDFLEKTPVKPDVIILDIMMPGMSGWDVIKKLKEDPDLEKIPVVFLTARVDYTARNAGKFLGDDYIEKPYDPDDLKHRIKKILEK